MNDYIFITKARPYEFIEAGYDDETAELFLSFHRRLVNGEDREIKVDLFKPHYLDPDDPFIDDRIFSDIEKADFIEYVTDPTVVKYIYDGAVKLLKNLPIEMMPEEEFTLPDYSTLPTIPEDDIDHLLDQYMYGTTALVEVEMTVDVYVIRKEPDSFIKDEDIFVRFTEAEFTPIDEELVEADLAERTYFMTIKDRSITISYTDFKTNYVLEYLTKFFKYDTITETQDEVLLGLIDSIEEIHDKGFVRMYNTEDEDNDLSKIPDQYIQ